jgi:hypothetical protein
MTVQAPLEHVDRHDTSIPRGKDRGGLEELDREIVKVETTLLQILQPLRWVADDLTRISVHEK